MKSRRFKYIVGLAIIIGAFSYLAWTSFRASFQFALTPSEFAADKVKYEGKSVRISGMIEAGTLKVEGQQHFFNIEDETQSLEVHYSGGAPNTLREGGEVVVTGKYDEGHQRFEATALLAKCASKYQAQ